MRSVDAHAQIVFWENLNVVILENNVPKVNFKGFMTNNAHANWIVLRKVYGNGDPSLPLEAQECTCFFHWATNLDKII